MAIHMVQAHVRRKAAPDGDHEGFASIAAQMAEVRRACEDAAATLRILTAEGGPLAQKALVHELRPKLEQPLTPKMRLLDGLSWEEVAPELEQALRGVKQDRASARRRTEPSDRRRGAPPALHCPTHCPARQPQPDPIRGRNCTC